MPTTGGPLRAAALTYREAGFSVVPAKEDKSPALRSWKRLMRRIPTRRDVEAMFSCSGVHGVGLVCGLASGNLECLDFDAGGRLFAPWREALAEDAPGLFERLAVERSRSGGRHVVFRCPDLDIPGSMKLARSPAGENLVETRGDGAYFIAAPTPGYEPLQGDLFHPPTVTAGEREAMIRLARALDESESPEFRVFKPAGARSASGDTWKAG